MTPSCTLPRWVQRLRSLSSGSRLRPRRRLRQVPLSPSIPLSSGPKESATTRPNRQRGNGAAHIARPLAFIGGQTTGSLAGVVVVVVVVVVVAVARRAAAGGGAGIAAAPSENHEILNVNIQFGHFRT